ncbi:hypothetical protein [Streptomyces sp. NPDC001020]
MDGWWPDRATAEKKFRDWVGEYGSLRKARLVLVDTVEGDQVASWPDGP